MLLYNKNNYSKKKSQNALNEKFISLDFKVKMLHFFSKVI